MHAWTGDTIGPLTRTVEDNALFLSVIAGYDERDRLTSRRSVADYASGFTAELKGVRLAVVKEMAWHAAIHPEVRTAFEQALNVTRGLGAEIAEVSLPWARHAIPLQMLTSDADATSMYLPLLRSRWDEFDVGTRTRMAAAALVPATIYSRAMRARAVVRGQILDALRDCDALVSPASLQPPQQIDAARETVEAKGDVEQRLIQRRICTHPFGAANVPALVLPMGFTHDVLPLGLQIAGRPFAEQMVYRIGHAYECATPWHDRHPDLDAVLERHLRPATALEG
jgi:aspartyl-tRNA(Asn)/glutamyl-tRNA(Gln) amidotransferase subunit A